MESYVQAMMKETKRWSVRKYAADDEVIALAGNPNVGKSTLFNALTGMRQHTGNWPGKTVANTQGYYRDGKQGYVLVDLPGCYSLLPHSQEEEIARDFICFGHPDAVVAVCDATCLERNLNLVLQILEAEGKVVVCVNLMDEAEKKNIQIDLKLLEELLGVPVVGTAARDEEGLGEIFIDVFHVQARRPRQMLPVLYPEPIEKALQMLEDPVRRAVGEGEAVRYISLRLLERDYQSLRALEDTMGRALCEERDTKQAVHQAREYLKEQGYGQKELADAVVSAYIHKAEEISRKTVVQGESREAGRDRRLDAIFTGPRTGVLCMFAILLGIFWITMAGANIPSELLSKAFGWLEEKLTLLADQAQVASWLADPLLQGSFRVAAWVVAVMLPPMAIFFPLFTILEDLGYLPRVAYNLDRSFQKCNACGKQALTMAMGLGCNAVGVTGCRIIDSPRERLIAILTNSMVPCNGRFPLLIAIISMFLVGSAAGPFDSFFAAVILAGVILLGIGMTFFVSRILSATVLKGVPSSFTLELPPYRIPQVGKVIIRSVLDRTLFVLGRAVAVAVPAGLVIWILANVQAGDTSLLEVCASFLDPLGQVMGMDGVILLAFILALPANEIVLPLILMIYMAQGSLSAPGSLEDIRQLLISHGWTAVTAVSTVLFSLLHWPCATTCLTIRKETGSLRWMGLAVLIPTLLGAAMCMIWNFCANMIF